MNRVFCICEGFTEQLFVREVLAPYMATKGIYLEASLLGKPGMKGGDVRYERAKGDIANFLKLPPASRITTMFDYFRIEAKWPGVASLKTNLKTGRTMTAHEKGQWIESATLEQLKMDFPDDNIVERMIPYIEMHEFEALLFTSPTAIAEVCQPGSARYLEQIVSGYATPEEINSDPNKAPSKQLEALIPTYRKHVHGKSITERIGIDSIRAICPHFNIWLGRMEQVREL